MSRAKQEMIERGEFSPLDLDRDSYADPDWWKQQDDEMTAEEERQIEILAEIQEYRTQGYM